MSLSVNIPEDLDQQTREIADAPQISVDEVIAPAFAEQVAALERLRRRVASGSRDRFLEVLEAVGLDRRDGY